MRRGREGEWDGEEGRREREKKAGREGERREYSSATISILRLMNLLLTAYTSVNTPLANSQQSPHTLGALQE